MCIKTPFCHLLTTFIPPILLQLVSTNLFAQPHFENNTILHQLIKPETQPVAGSSSISIEQERSISLQPKQEIEHSESEGTQKNDEQTHTKESADQISVAETLHNDLALTERLININLVKKNWNVLSELLPIYAEIKENDPILLSYALGALYRYQGKHDHAIDEYRNILATQPELVYVRFDLAAMLFENKEYEAAEDQFHKVNAAKLPEQMHVLSKQYLEAIQKQAKWKINAGIQYNHNDNVNNASSIGTIRIGPLVFTKDEDALPKSANGIGYNLGAHRDFNIHGHHYLSVDTNIYGMDYWDHKKYSEVITRASVGYKYQNFQSAFSLAPFVEQSWLGGQRYGFNQGVTAEYKRWLNNQYQAISSYSFIHKTYSQSFLKGYEGDLHGVSLSLIYYHSPTLIFLGGVDTQRDLLENKDESSQKHGLRTGVIKEWKNGFSSRINLRVAKRTFDDLHFFMQKTRKDEEYQVDFSFWHRKLHWKDITPKINFRYTKIHSNIAEFYSRNSQQIFLSFEKTF